MSIKEETKPVDLNQKVIQDYLDGVNFEMAEAPNHDDLRDYVKNFLDEFVEFCAKQKVMVPAPPPGWKLLPPVATTEMLLAASPAFEGVATCINVAQLHGVTIHMKDGLPPLWHAYRLLFDATPAPGAVLTIPAPNTVKPA